MSFIMRAKSGEQSAFGSASKRRNAFSAPRGFFTRIVTSEVFRQVFWEVVWQVFQEVVWGVFIIYIYIYIYIVMYIYVLGKARFNCAFAKYINQLRFTWAGVKYIYIYIYSCVYIKLWYLELKIASKTQISAAAAANFRMLHLGVEKEW